MIFHAKLEYLNIVLIRLMITNPFDDNDDEEFARRFRLSKKVHEQVTVLLMMTSWTHDSNL